MGGNSLLAFAVLCCLFTLTLGEIKFLAPGTTVRFCALPPQATNFTCHPIEYVESVASRGLPVACLTAFFLVVVTFLICLPCLARIDCCSCIGTEPTFGDTRYGNCRQGVWFTVAVVILLIGCGCGIYASVKSNDILYTTTTTLQTKSIQLLDVMTNIRNQLTNTTITVPQDLLDAVLSKLGEVNGDIRTFSVEIKKTTPLKDIYTWISAAWIVLLGAVSLMYVATGNRFLFHLIGFMAFWTLFGLCLYLISMSILSSVFSDLCAEFNYTPSFFDLIQKYVEDNYAVLYTDLEVQQVKFIKQTCDNIDDHCTKQPDLCSTPCNTTTFDTLPSRHVTDEDQTVKRVDECAQQCVDTQLKNISQMIVDAVNANELVNNVTTMMKDLMVGFVGTEMREVIRVVSCDAPSVINPLWVGCAFVLLGLIFQNVALLALDRAICCFKYERYNSDDYQELRQI
eukprot:TRINITY_DN6022_c0_g1_i1.p1 TRINITY_DN6022_c0_g1~~TRINITY_DN6022_c0_g1_i1.p1  ORF type:complete len:455 (-),score=81.98 TRINITY_DN6022_c0_g1_i1:113-1477(-)